MLYVLMLYYATQANWRVGIMTWTLFCSVLFRSVPFSSPTKEGK